MSVILFVDPCDASRKPGDAIVGPFDGQSAERWLTKKGWSQRHGYRLGNYWEQDGRLVEIVRLESPEELEDL